MKANEFTRRSKALEQSLEMMRKNQTPLDDERRKLNDATRRQYVLGPAADAQPAPPVVEVWFSTFFGRLERRLHLLDGSGPGSIGGSLDGLSSAQFVLLAEIVEVAEKWQRGEIDALPPSGPWRRQ